MRNTTLVALCLVSCFCFSAHELKAQQYQPMPSGPARWDVARCWYFYPAGWHDLYYIEMDGTDTLINGKTYKKLYHTTHHAPGTEFDSTYTHFLGGMREENRRVYMISEYLALDTIERMIYDFNYAEVGDTIYTQVLTNGLTQFVPHIVTAITEVDINGEPVRQIHVQDENAFFTETWTEGIGSSMGLVYASYWILTDNSYDLSCFYTGNNLSYTNTEATYSFCTPPLPPGECELILSTPEPDAEPMAVDIFPNPVYSDIHIEGQAEIQRVQLFNTMGTKMMDVPYKSTINLSQLSAGLYLIQLQGKSTLQTLVKRIHKL